MKKYILMLLALMVSSIIYAAEQDTIKYFVDNNNKRCQPGRSFYYRIAAKDGNWWHVKDYYCAEGSLYKDATYAKYEKDSFMIEQGTVIIAHANKVLAQKVRYINGQKEGLQKNYDTTGRLVDSTFFKKGIPCKGAYRWTSEGSLIFKGIYDDAGDGIGEEWEYHEDGQLSGYGKTIKGYKRDSVWTYYHKNGSKSSVEQYLDDSLISIQCFNEDGSVSTTDCSPEKMPEAPYHVNNFLGKNMHYPADARDNGIQGTVYVSFFISEEGSITDPKIVGPRLGGGCEQEALRVVALLPKWKPGIYHNRHVKVYYTLPLSFRLE